MKEVEWTDEFIRKAKQRSKDMAEASRIKTYPQRHTDEEMLGANETIISVGQEFGCLIPGQVDIASRVALDEVVVGIYHLSPSRVFFRGYSLDPKRN